MGKVKDLTGMRFGKLTVISQEPNGVRRDGTTYSVWKYKCDCGTTKVSTAQNLKLILGNCGCERSINQYKNSEYYKQLDLTGQTFGSLVVIKRVPNNRKHSITFLCSCECGKQKEITGSYLRAKKPVIKSCGCKKLYLPKKKGFGEVAFKALYNGYKLGAKYRSLPFNLSEEHFRSLTKLNCNYCGLAPQMINKRKNSLGHYVYNGVDRINSELGYSVENCVPCCKKCNWAKSNDTFEEFSSWINRITAYQQGEKK